MRVGVDDVHDLEAQRLDGVQNFLGIPAGIDYDPLVSALVSHDVAICQNRPDGQLLDDQSNPSMFAWFLITGFSHYTAGSGAVKHVRILAVT